MRLTIIGIAIACLTSTMAMATDYKAGSIEIIDPWSRVLMNDRNLITT